MELFLCMRSNLLNTAKLNYKLDVTAMHKQSLVHEVKRPWHLEAYCEGHGSYWWLCGCPSFMEIDVRTGQTDTAIFYNLKYKPVCSLNTMFYFCVFFKIRFFSNQFNKHNLLWRNNDLRLTLHWKKTRLPSFHMSVCMVCPGNTGLENLTCYMIKHWSKGYT